MNFPRLSPPPTPPNTPLNGQQASNSPAEQEWLFANLINEINNSEGILNYTGYFEERLVQQNSSSTSESGDEGGENTN